MAFHVLFLVNYFIGEMGWKLLLLWAVSLRNQIQAKDQNSKDDYEDYKISNPYKDFRLTRLEDGHYNLVAKKE